MSSATHRRRRRFERFSLFSDVNCKSRIRLPSGVASSSLSSGRLSSEQAAADPSNKVYLGGNAIMFASASQVIAEVSTLLTGMM